MSTTTSQCARAYISIFHGKQKHSAAMDWILHEVVYELVQYWRGDPIEGIAMGRPLGSHDV